MVSASILPTKGRAAVPPDQLQTLPLKVPGRVSSQQLAIAVSVRKSHPEPPDAGQDNAARQQAQDFEATIGTKACDIAVGVQSYELQPRGPAAKRPDLSNTLANPGSRKQEAPDRGQGHEKDQKQARDQGQAGEQKQALPQARFRREDGLESG